MANMNDGNNENFTRDLMGFMIVCGVIGGPALLVAWAIFKLIISVLF
jgi:hypothetical protein